MLTLLPDRSDRLMIRPVIRADRDALVAANRLSRDYHAPWATPFIDDEGFERWWAKHVVGPNSSVVAHEVASGTLVGIVSLTEIVLGALRSAYLGFHGYDASAGRGLMTDAVRLACRHGFGLLGLHRVEANIQPGNTRSIALVRRLGFRQEGQSSAYLHVESEWRDHARWALLDRELDRAPADAPDPPTDTVERFWAGFHAETGLGGARCPGVAAFGAGRDQQDALAEMVRRGRKRATVSRAAEYGPGSTVIPAPGDLTVVLDGAAAPVSVIRTTEIRLGPLGSVDDAFAFDEGEGDRTRAGWIAIHRSYWEQGGVAVDDRTELVFERFAAIWPDETAFPFRSDIMET